MRFGVLAGRRNVGSYDHLLRVARATEAAGYDSFFRSDHQLNLDGDYSVPITEAWVTLAGLARETSRVRLGTLVSPLTFRHPAVLARMVTAVDEMSGGRIELGLGLGGYAPDNDLLGLPLPSLTDRADQLSEQLQVIRGLWTDRDYSFDGRHYRIAHARLEPRPFQQPHPPLIVGAKGKPRLIRLAARLADEYNLDNPQLDVCNATRDILRAELDVIGRPRDAVRLSLLLDWPEDPDEGTTRAQIDAYEEAGVDRIFYMLPERSRAVDALEQFAGRFIH